MPHRRCRPFPRLPVIRLGTVHLPLPMGAGSHPHDLSMRCTEDHPPVCSCYRSVLQKVTMGSPWGSTALCRCARWAASIVTMSCPEDHVPMRRTPIRQGSRHTILCPWDQREILLVRAISRRQIDKLSRVLATEAYFLMEDPRGRLELCDATLGRPMARGGQCVAGSRRQGRAVNQQRSHREAHAGSDVRLTWNVSPDPVEGLTPDANRAGMSADFAPPIAEGLRSEGPVEGIPLPFQVHPMPEARACGKTGMVPHSRRPHTRTVRERGRRCTTNLHAGEQPKLTP